MVIFDSHNYRVVREDRPTALAQVFEATHPDRPGRLLVEILNGWVGASAALEAFERDIATVSLLGHPCVLEVLDLGALSDGTPVVISEHPDGVTLSRWLERKRIAPIAAALDVIAGLAEALTAAHECGVSHGLLSPEQVYLAKDSGGIGLPKLRGFGQRWLDASAGPRAAAGTARPSSDEIAEDVRALAAIAELLLSPPDRRGVADGLGFGTTPAVAEVIRNASAGGEDGFASPRAFAAALFIAAESEPEPVREALVPAAVRALVRWPQTPRLAIGLAAGVSLSLVIAVTAAVVSEVATPVHARSLAALNVATAPPVSGTRTREPAVPAARSPAAVAVAFPAPATVTSAGSKTPPVPTIREPRRSSSALRGVVWSDQHQGLVSAHERSKPIDTAAAPTTPPPFEETNP
jgi:serine/threonine-protein kinase